jgi:hypothetical protein
MADKMYKEKAVDLLSKFNGNTEHAINAIELVKEALLEYEDGDVSGTYIFYSCVQNELEEMLDGR